MRTLSVIMASALLVGLAACDGPREQAGEIADNASGAVDGQDSINSGPAETMGEREDEAAEAANEARDAAADALDQRAEAAEAKAGEQAEQLRQRADEVRKQ